MADSNIVELKKAASEHMIEGQRLFEMQDYAGACNELARSCEAHSQIYGESSPHCLRVLMFYGGALLSLGRSENQAIKVKPAAAATTTNGAATEANGNNEEEMEVDAAEDEQKQEAPTDTPADDKPDETDVQAEEEDEPDDNLKLAIAIFDLINRICEESAPKAKNEAEVIEVQIAKSDCLLRKSEVLQELDQFDEALACCEESLTILKSCKAEDINRLLAEASYLYGVTLDNMERYKEAVEAFEQALNYLTLQLKKAEQSGSDSVDEINELIKDVAGRIVDLKMASDAGIQEYLQKITSSGRTFSQLTKEQAHQAVTDITAKIRKLPIPRFMGQNEKN